jgi:arylsulfatase A-like enzyme
MPENSQPPSGVDESICIHQSVELTKHYQWPGGVGNITRKDAIRQRRAYYAAVAYVDAQIGRLLNELRSLACANDTIVLLWSDHGWQLGEHKMFSKHSNYEVATNSPLIIRVPGLKDPGVACDGIVEAVDVFPTLSDVCGLPLPPGLAGSSLRPMLDDPAVVGKTDAYSTHRGGRGYRGHALRSDRYRLVCWINNKQETGLVELYDYENDPLETLNIASSHPKLVQDMTSRLMTKMKEVVTTSHAN